MREAITLATEQLGDALPGPLLQLLAEAAKARARRGRDGAVELGDLVDALATVTGLPRVLVDPDEHLDLDALRAHFEEVVIGQPEAVTAIVERLAMAKAGLTDPTRPLAVLLFVGPTGTGKTELAKQLAEFLSGSASALIRFDMTEFQSWGAAERLLGGDDAPGSASGLVAEVSARPASVVLLDEFEKAHPSVWDVFLQIFDDARASNAKGDVASFRHAIVIMTSNLGARARASTAVGFGPGGPGSPPPAGGESMLRAVEREFRPEFVNRIDRIITFRSLTRSVMRLIVRKELAAVEELRGLRTRPWAIEWDDSAIEALLREGFTTDMGARPLKRAIERHVLAPLARSIVGRAVPSGDQFLFVRAGSDAPIEVQFVDPDAPEESGQAVRPRPDTDSSSPRAIAVDPLGTVAERDVLLATLDPVRARIGGRPFAARKDELLARMTEDGFWESPERHDVLAEAERLDRLEAGLRTGVALAERLAHVAGRAGAAELTRLLAQRLFLLEEELAALDAGEPRDAWLLVRPTADGADGQWPQRLVAMYRGWGQLRGMTIDDRARAGGEHLLDISGFAAFRLLRGETGLHVWEAPRDGRQGIVRQAALVVCTPQTAGAPPVGAPARPTIVRRYREQPSPLVRDSARGWRTGRLGTVLDGNFDLMS
jgi:ATP-dependent Clp protease ATP-binding subunit ClpC